MYFHSPTRADRSSLQPKCSRGYQLSAIDTGTSRRAPPSSSDTQALAGRRCGRASVAAGETGDRRRDVDAAHLLARRRAGLRPGAGHDQRHVQRGVVEEEPMIRFAVLAERLAVIGGDDDAVRERSSGFSSVPSSAST